MTGHHGNEDMYRESQPALRQVQYSALCSITSFEDWVRSADPGDRIVYCVGPWLPSGAEAALARKLLRGGVVELAQRRNRFGGFDYLAIKRRHITRKAS
ncbi:hypothetical protein AQ1_01156 [alpha proteobacterium Q-1]|nr:hypothetical protein [Iodidimonas nitroreducens]GAK33269.1 hypothetical protein AQ1_01156 [alpha proteobacterium Q-1]